MARQGQRIDNPATGERIEFRKTARDTDGEAVVFDYYLRPGGFAVGKADHAHPEQEERFEVKEGRLGVRIDGDEWTATPGTRFGILPETRHTVWNDGSDVMHAVVEIRPGLAIEAFFETMFGLARDGKTNSVGLPNPLQLAVIAHEFRDELYLGYVPRPVQRGLAATVAPLGKRAGYRARYPRYENQGERSLLQRALKR